jgi:uncharacterized protein DUF4386
MQTPRRDIWTPLAGFAAAVTFVVGVILASNSPDNKDPDAKVLSFYAKHSNRVGIIVGAYVLVFFALFLIWFAAGLRQRLRGAEGPGGRLTDVALGGGILSAVGIAVGGIALASVSAGQSFGGSPLHTADIARYLASFGFGMILIVGMFGAIALIDAVSIVIMRTGVLPRWLGWLGFVCGVLLLFGVVFLPMIALPVWLIAASIVLWGRESPEAAAAPPPPA